MIKFHLSLRVSVCSRRSGGAARRGGGGDCPGGERYRGLQRGEARAGGPGRGPASRAQGRRRQVRRPGRCSIASQGTDYRHSNQLMAHHINGGQAYQKNYDAMCERLRPECKWPQCCKETTIWGCVRRIYERLRAEKQAEDDARDERERLVDLMYQEQVRVRSGMSETRCSAEPSRDVSEVVATGSSSHLHEHVCPDPAIYT